MRIGRNWFCWRTSHSTSRKKTSWIKGFYPITISLNSHSTPRFALYIILKPSYFTLHTFFCSVKTKVKWKLKIFCLWVHPRLLFLILGRWGWPKEEAKESIYMSRSGSGSGSGPLRISIRNSPCDQAGPQWSVRVMSGGQSIGQGLYQQGTWPSTGMARAELKQAIQQHRSSGGWSSRPEFIWTPGSVGRVCGMEGH